MNSFDFEADLHRELKKVSSSMGFRLSDNNSLDKKLLDYFTIRAKMIEPKPREVLINPEFRQTIQNHVKRKEIEYIIAAAGVGNNINCFQSKRLLQATFHDHLQNEWKIFHFHLSLEQEKEALFVKQVNTLLFAYITDEYAIFLGTDTHCNGIFGNKKWIEILHRFFPDVIRKYRIDIATAVHPDINAKERQELWNSGWTTGANAIDDVVYYSPGLGRMSTGHSINVVRTADDIIVWIETLKGQINGSYEVLCSYLNVSAEIAVFKIRLGNIGLELYEEKSEKTLLSFPNIFIEKST